MCNWISAFTLLASDPISATISETAPYHVVLTSLELTEAWLCICFYLLSARIEGLPVIAQQEK